MCEKNEPVFVLCEGFPLTPDAEDEIWKKWKGLETDPKQNEETLTA
ncbi:MAG: hypothetical protein HYV76_01450 [Candidatus Vogelbacteria bacterium]|nr:hypothetical protein [Candidatus Vogelbacteria bacterium]